VTATIEAGEIKGVAVAEPLAAEPDLETAIQLCHTEEAARIQPYLASLLRKLYPLLQVCNQQLKLGIDDALETIRQRLDK